MKKVFTNKEWEVVRHVTEVYKVTAPTKQEALDLVDELESNCNPIRRFQTLATAKRTDWPGRRKKS